MNLSKDAIFSKVNQAAKEGVKRFKLTASNSCGKCAKASVFLFRKLKHIRRKIYMYCSSYGSHAFLVFFVKNKKYVLDITYNQFDLTYEQIVIDEFSSFKKRLCKHYCFSSSFNIHRTSNLLKIKNLTKEWPIYQRPYIRKNK